MFMMLTFLHPLTDWHTRVRGSVRACVWVRGCVYARAIKHASARV